MDGAPVKVTIEDGRVFVPLVEQGCGVGCKYCYISEPRGRTRAISSSRLRGMLDALKDSACWHVGPDGPLIAVGHDTEFGASDATIVNVLLCLEFAQKHRLPVQLATKFPLPYEIRSLLEAWPSDQPRPVAFTTITTVALSQRLEPGAPSPALRAENFQGRGGPWLSYALIKPFLNLSIADLDALLKLLVESRPDGVVIGIRYRRNAATDGQRTELGVPRHPTAAGWVAVAFPRQAREFMAKLRDSGFRVFMSTRCVSAWHNTSSHGQMVRRMVPQLCVECGACSRVIPRR